MRIGSAEKISPAVISTTTVRPADNKQNGSSALSCCTQALRRINLATPSRFSSSFECLLAGAHLKRGLDGPNNSKLLLNMLQLYTP